MLDYIIKIWEKNALMILCVWWGQGVSKFLSQILSSYQNGHRVRHNLKLLILLVVNPILEGD